MLRSEFMTLCQIVDHKDAARSVVCELGELGVGELKDLNSDLAVYKRVYSEDVRRCNDLLRKLAFIMTQLQKAGLKPVQREPSEMMRVSSHVPLLLSTPLSLTHPRSRIQRNCLLAVPPPLQDTPTTTSIHIITFVDRR